MCAVIGVTSGMATYMSEYMTILVGIVVSVCAGVPIILLTVLLSNKKKPVRMVGFFLYICVFLLSFYIMLVNAAQMGVDESNKWTYSYLISFLVDTFPAQIFAGFIKLNILNWAIKKKPSFTKLITKVF